MIISIKALRGVAYGAGRFVAVGDNGAIMVSVGCSNWVEHSAIGTNALNAISFALNRFIAIGDAGSIFTSGDGTDWTPADSGVTNQLENIGFGNGMVVAVGTAGAIVTSTNGLDWLPENSGVTIDLHGIAFGTNRFVAVGSGVWSTVIVTSSDGSNWVQPQYPLPGPETARLADVVYSQGRFVAIGTYFSFDPGGAYVTFSSIDGVNWALLEQEGDSPPLPEGPCSTLAYGDGQFVADGRIYGEIAASTDGLNWIHEGYRAMSGFAFGNGRLVAVGSHGLILEAPSRIRLTMTPNAVTGSVILSGNGPVGLSYTLQSSLNLADWQIVTNFMSVQSPITILESISPAEREKFYRAQVLGN